MRVRDRGSAFLLTMLVGLALTGAALLAVVPTATVLIDHQQARSAADAAALAGVAGGRAAAASIAADNGAELVGFSVDGRRVTVTVSVGGRTATARATDEP